MDALRNVLADLMPEQGRRALAPWESETLQAKTPATARKFGILESYNRVAPAALQTPRGQTPKGLASMPDQCIPTTTEETTEDAIPYGYCQCGCGLKTAIAQRNHRRDGHIKGEPRRYVRGHNEHCNADNVYVDRGNGTTVLVLRTRSGIQLDFLVDTEDVPRMREYQWHAMRSRSRFYASGNPREYPRTQKSILLHRFLVNAPKGKQVDHWDGDSLNTRKANLRHCTNGQNQANRRMDARNTSGFKGVSWKPDEGRWFAYITHEGRRYSLGRHDSRIEAAMAYDRAAVEMFGEFALTNAALGLLDGTEA